MYVHNVAYSGYIDFIVKIRYIFIHVYMYGHINIYVLHIHAFCVQCFV